ncbi:hypothetical protein G5I_13116 [Acromyrmex echinatior]|uniref:Uncharacterized protein n=1 Tax=Acromyrmex echinatior TaxID=103372 RepID=F4X458_ACREC|nr:hypothetical protein G5I_13116 [Acromyrmex echinatior]
MSGTEKGAARTSLASLGSQAEKQPWKEIILRALKSKDLRPRRPVQHAQTATCGIAADEKIFENRCCERDCRGEEWKKQDHEGETSVAVAAVKLPIRVRLGGLGGRKAHVMESGQLNDRRVEPCNIETNDKRMNYALPS